MAHSQGCALSLSIRIIASQCGSLVLGVVFIAVPSFVLFYFSILSQVSNTPCLTIPNMENWKCATLTGPHSLSVASTTAVVSFIIVFIVFAYWGHMYYHRKMYSKLGAAGMATAGELGA